MRYERQHATALYKALFCCMGVAGLWLISHGAWADFPVGESTGITKGKLGGEWLGVVWTYLTRGVKLLIIGVSIIGFLWVSYGAIAKFNECRNGRAEWSELALLIILAAALFTFNSLLVTTSGDIFGGSEQTVKQQTEQKKAK